MAQHPDLSVSCISLSCHREEQDNSVRLVYRIRPALDVPTMIENKKTKEQVRDDLAHLNRDPNIVPLVRDYVGSLGRMQKLLRETWADFVKEWDDLINSSVERYESKFKMGCVRLSAVGRDADKRVVESVSVFGGIIKRRQLLETKCAFLDKVSTA